MYKRRSDGYSSTIQVTLGKAGGVIVTIEKPTGYYSNTTNNIRLVFFMEIVNFLKGKFFEPSK